MTLLFSTEAIAGDSDLNVTKSVTYTVSSLSPLPPNTTSAVAKVCWYSLHFSKKLAVGFDDGNIQLSILNIFLSMIHYNII